MKKNCLNCRHLTYEEEQDSDGYVIGGGYNCEKRIETACEQGKEDELWTNLSRPEYREKGKVCFESRAN